jgi:cytochrome c5
MLRLACCKLIVLLLLGAICAHAAAAPPAAATDRPGEEIFQTYCAECHSTGISGAPRISDKAAWAQRIAQGQAVLLQHALHGYKGMPGRGSCSTCTDAEIKASVEFIIGKVK